MIREKAQIRQELMNSRKKLIGMTIGSGLFYKYAIANQMNLLLVLNASRFRQMGLSSLAGSLPFDNSNRLVFDFAMHEIMPNDPETPVFFGLCATDPTIHVESFLKTLINNGFAGICNLPSVTILDGVYGEALAEAGFTYDKEVEALAMAHKMGLLTIGMVRNQEQAVQMLDAGCDIICVYLGAASGGILGAKLEVSIKDAMDLINEIFVVCRQIRSDVALMIYGGPAKTPASIGYLMMGTNADGFIGGYTFERIMMEQAYKEKSMKSLFFREEDLEMRNQKKQSDYVSYLMEYIDKHYMENISFEELADQLHVSRTHLSALFKKENGESFRDCLITIRMQKASNLLINTDLPVKDILERIGYNDYANFCKAFKKKMGVTPAKYREQYKMT